MPTAHQKNHPSGKVVAVRLDPETITRIDRLAARTSRNRSSYLRVAIKALLPVLEQQHWEQTITEFEDDKLQKDFREVTYALMEEERAQANSPHARRWENPNEPLN